jgi:X box-binding protein 1
LLVIKSSISKVQIDKIKLFLSRTNKNTMASAVPAILKYLSDSSNYNIDQNMDVPVRAKKRRLDHLSWEEKLQRKKLKNRVAAQTSRDRKKAKMDQMEKALQELFAKNEDLLEQCEKLKTMNERLSAENAEFRTRLSTSCVNCSQNRTVVCETESGSAESLLRPRGTVTHSAAVLRQQTTALLKIVLACLLYRTSLTSSTATWTSHLSNNSRRAYFKISPETWRLLLKRQIFKNKLLVKKTVQDKWWGRHQNSWNPVEVTC